MSDLDDFHKVFADLGGRLRENHGIMGALERLERVEKSSPVLSEDVETFRLPYTSYVQPTSQRWR